MIEVSTPADISCFPATGTTPPSQWQWGTVREVERVTPRLVVLKIAPDTPPIGQLAGQHYVVRLTAEDGYSASRSYSVSSPPGAELLELCVERFDDGEVSGYLYDVVEPDDRIEIRGPIGGWFVWDASCPAVLVGGGTGVVPLVAMLRSARQLGKADLLRLAVSGATASDIPYLDELREAGAVVALTRSGGQRLTGADLMPLLPAARAGYVCGSAPFAEAMSLALVGAGMPVQQIRVERFGPTG